jgi:peptide deformylase
VAVLPVVKYGDSILRKKVNKVDISHLEKLTDLIDDMFDTMYEEEGIGLAANQVGVNLNLMIIDVSHLDEYKDLEPIVFFNSEISEEYGCIELEEGCLSIPEIRATIPRAETIVVQYTDELGNHNTKHFDGMLCRVILHEMDHLNGKFFTDYLSPAKRKLIHSKLLEIAQDGFPSTGVVL